MNPHLKTSKNRPLNPLKLNKTNLQVSDSEVVLSIHCKYCGNRCIKNGIEKTGKQRYKCNSCKKSQQSDYRYHAYDQNLNQNIIALTKEGVGIRGTARLLGISPTTLISRIKKIASQIKAPPLVKGKTYEVDELRTFVKKKEG
jgi:insertion element IS1 protein InsB